MHRDATGPMYDDVTGRLIQMPEPSPKAAPLESFFPPTPISSPTEEPPVQKTGIAFQPMQFIRPPEMPTDRPSMDFGSPAPPAQAPQPSQVTQDRPATPTFLKPLIDPPQFPTTSGLASIPFAHIQTPTKAPERFIPEQGQPPTARTGVTQSTSQTAHSPFRPHPVVDQAEPEQPKAPKFNRPTTWSKS